MSGAWFSPLSLRLCTPFRLRTSVPEASSPSFLPLEGPVFRAGPAPTVSLRPHLAERLCLGPHPVPRRKGSRPPLRWAGAGSTLEDQSVEVTATATGRTAASRRAFVLILVFVEAPPPVRRCGECRDVGRPASGLLLLLLGTQMPGGGGRLKIQAPKPVFPALCPQPHPSAIQQSI